MGTRERLVAEKTILETLCGFEAGVNFDKNDMVPALIKSGFPDNNSTGGRIWKILGDSVNKGILVSTTDFGRGHRKKNIYSIASNVLVLEELKKVQLELNQYNKDKGFFENSIFHDSDDITEIKYIISILEIIVARSKPLSIPYVEKKLNKTNHPITANFISNIIDELVALHIISSTKRNLKLFIYDEVGKETLYIQLNLYRDLLHKLIVSKKSIDEQTPYVNNNDIPNNGIPHGVGMIDSLEFIRSLPDEKFVVKELEKYLKDEGLDISFQEANMIVAKLDHDRIIRVSSGLNKSIYQVSDRSKLLKVLDELKQQELENQKTLDIKSNPIIGKDIDALQLGIGMFELCKEQYRIIDDLKNQRSDAYLAIELHKETCENLKEENTGLKLQLEELNNKISGLKSSPSFTPRNITDNFDKDPL